MTYRNVRLVLFVQGATGLMMAGAAQAAEEQSWICQYLPSACGSESDPGGLPGHTSGGSGSETRGLSPETDAEPPAAAAPAPAEPAPPPSDDEKKGY